MTDWHDRFSSVRHRSADAKDDKAKASKDLVKKDMKRKLIKNIGKLIGIVPEGMTRKEGAEMSEAGTIGNAWLLIEGERIAAFGTENDEMLNQVQHDRNVLQKNNNGDNHTHAGLNPTSVEESGIEVIDAEGGYVMPSFCDSHSHIVYAGSREGEFIDKINGLTYEQIAARGGGILNSADLLHETSEEELFRQSLERAVEVMRKGTGALEIKSGYGLNTEDELKMLRVIRRLKAALPMEIRATFLGAHAVGRKYTGRQSEYVDMVCREMLPAVASENLADYADVFCDSGFFTPQETMQILDAAQVYGLRGKIHANELAVSGGVQAGVSRNALSVDHLERTTDEEIAVLKGSETMPTMLPGASFFSNLPYGRAKDYIKAGLGVALASDYNPGSSPSGDMRFVMALGCIRMRLTPEEAFNACTLNSAYAMGISGIAGSVTAGKLANLIITRPLPSLAFIPYSHQTPFISRLILKGNEILPDGR